MTFRFERFATRQIKPSARTFVLASALSFALTSLSCTRKSKSSVASDVEVFDLDVLTSEGEPIRLALMDPQALDLVKRTHENLVKSKSEMPEALASLMTASRSLFGSLNMAARYGNKTEKAEGGVFRHDAFELKADISKTFITGQRGDTALPFGLSKGGRIDVKRWFASDAEAAKAPIFDLGDLPLDADSARRMKPGEYFGVPTNTSLFLNANGGFLQRAVAWHKEAALLPFFQNALQGSLTAVPEGHLLGKGTFHLHILKVDENRVRVKVTTHQSMEGGAKFKVKASANNHYVFFPGTRLSKLTGLKTIQEIRKPRRLLDLAGKAKNVKERVLPAVFAQLERLAPAVMPNGAAVSDPTLAGIVRASGVLEKVDRFVEAAERVSETVDELNARTTRRYNKLVGEINAKSFDKVQQFIDKSIDVEAAVDLSGEFAKGLRLVADYVVDLSTPEGRIAFDRMVSGRVVMQARDKVVAPWHLQDAALADFSYVDALADLDASKQDNQKRAERKAQMADSFARGDVGLTFRILDWSRGFSERWADNDVTFGSDVRYKLKTWEFENALNFGGADTEAKSSGLLYPAGQDGKASGYGNYFYTWKRHFAPGHVSSMRDTLTQTVNVLGPTAFLLGIPGRYAGEVPGNTTIDLSIVYLPGALASFFDPTTTDDQMWKAFGATMRGWYRGRDPLPHLTSARAESYIDSPVGKAQCQTLLQTEWGQGYCDAFRKTFLVKWKAASSGTLQDQHAFLASWYAKGWLANKAGGDLLSRFFNELLFEKHAGAWMKDVVVRLDYENTEDASEVANPDFAFGDNPAGEVVETINASLD